MSCLNSLVTETAVDNSIDRLDGQVQFVSSDPSGAVYWPDFLAQFDGFFFFFCTLGLMYVVLSQYTRHRRRRKNLEKMRAYWREQRPYGQQDFGADPKLRLDTGFWGSSE